VLLVAISALLFPIPLAFLMTRPNIMAQFGSKAEMFDGLFNFTMGYAVELLLPCIVGVLAAMLFFMERDHDTFKSLRAIPVTGTQMVMAKVITLFLFAILFCLVTTLTLTICGSVMLGGANGLIYKFFMSVEMGLFITAGTLPIIVLVVFFSRTYIFSVLLCVFYSVLSLTLESLFGSLPKLLCWAMPIPLTTLWSAGDMVKHGMPLNLKDLEGLVPSTLQISVILCATAMASVFIIDQLYKIRSDG